MRPRHVECSTRRGRFFYFYSVLFRNAVVSNDVRSLFQNILLVSCLPWVIVVDHIRHTVFISTVRHYADMSFEDHNITALPLFRFGNIRGQGSCRVRKNTFRFRTRRKSMFASGSAMPYSSGCSRMSASTRVCRSYPAFFKAYATTSVHTP